MNNMSNDELIALLLDEMDEADKQVCTGGSRCGCDECFNERLGTHKPKVWQTKYGDWVKHNPEALVNPLCTNWYVPATPDDMPDGLLIDDQRVHLPKPGNAVSETSIIDRFKNMIGM